MAAWIASQPDLPYLLMGALGLLIILWILSATRASRHMREEQAARAQAEARAGEEIARLTARLAAGEEDRREAHVRAERLEETVAGLRDQIGALRQERGALQAALDSARSQAEGLRGELRVRETAAEKDRAAAEREIAQLRELREEMGQRFRELADESLRRQGEDAAKVQQERLAALLTPLKEHVGRFEEELRAVHRAADQERARLGEHIAMLHRRSEEISQEAVALTRALKGDKQRQGAWGEMILERILEDSGLERGTHYLTQDSRLDAEGRRQRPDVVVRMPGGRQIIVDSKVSLVAYEAAVNAETPEERDRQLRAHLQALNAHVTGLSRKDYAATEAGAADYVLMFVPVEGALSEALRLQGDLTSQALARGVGIVSPMTLMVTLRMVENLWTVDRRERNAEEIAARAGALYDKLAGFVEAMNGVSLHLARAVGAHEEAMGRLSRGHGNLLGQADKLKKLGARTAKQIAHDFDEEAPALPSHAAE